MVWSTRVFDTATGNPVLDVNCGVDDSADWTRRLGGEGSGSHTFNLAGLGIATAQVRELFADQKHTIAACWGNYVVYAGVIQETKYSRNSGTVTVSHDEIRNFFRARMQFGVGAASGGDLTVTGRTSSGAVRAILARAMQHSAEWVLPIDLPADGAGTFSATWAWWRFLTIDDLLTEMEEQGVEIDFRPYINGSGQLRYQTVVGTPIVGSATDVPVTAKKSLVKNLQVRTDSTRRVTGVIVAGEGSEAGTLLAWAGNGAGTNPIPIRDVYRSQKDIDDPVKLQAVADTIYAESMNPVEQWSFDLHVSDEFTPELAAVSRVMRMDVRGDPWIPDGMYQKRVIALKGDLSMTVKPEVQAYGA